MTEALLLALKVCVALLILAIGMCSTWQDLVYLWRRPGLMLRSMLAMYVGVPLAALLLVLLLPLSEAARAALLVLAASAGAPLLPSKLRGLGNDAYTFSLVSTSSLLAIALVPAWVGLLARYLGVRAEVDLPLVAMVIAKAFLLPLALGMGLRWLWPRAIARAGAKLLDAVTLLVVVCAALLVAANWEVFRAMVGWGMAALVLLMLAALAVGHVMGGPRPEDRTSLAVACATRHFGVALLVATAFPGPRTATLIAAYLLATTAVTLPYLRWRLRHAHTTPPPVPQDAAPR